MTVVDNGSRDDTAAQAARCGARVVTEPIAGYGAAVQAGLLAATRDYVGFMDGDGSFDPQELLPLLDDVRSGRAQLAVGRRRPVHAGVWPGTRAPGTASSSSGCGGASTCRSTTSRPRSHEQRRRDRPGTGRRVVGPGPP